MNVSNESDKKIIYNITAFLKNSRLLCQHVPNIKAIILTDTEISYEGIEMKKSPIENESGFSYFCYAQGAKIKKSAHHLFLNIAVVKKIPEIGNHN